MFNRISDNTKLRAVTVLHIATSRTVALAAAAKKQAQDHPTATSLAVGVVAGGALAVALVDGEKVHPESLYARIVN